MFLPKIKFREMSLIENIDIDKAIKLFNTNINTLSPYELLEGEKKTAIRY